MASTVLSRQQDDERKAKKEWQDIRSQYKRNKIRFTDEDFPPSNESIGHLNNAFEWHRIADIKTNSTDRYLDWTVYNSPKPSDIQQGHLGNCWLLAALTLITERPNMLKQILLTDEVNREGIYLVRLCHNGLWKSVIVDDYFPCKPNKQLAFSKASGRQMYVPLIEKACAKLFGSYSELASGRTHEGLQLFTGAPCFSIDLNPSEYVLDRNIVWAKLLSAFEANLLVGTETGRSDLTEVDYKNVNIRNSHSFSMLAVRTLSNTRKSFVLLRDPHAETKYREEQITSDVLRQLNSTVPSPLPSGAFWISWPAFLRFFSSIIILACDDSDYDIRKVAKFTQSSTESIPTFRLFASKSSEINISVVYHRKDRKKSIIHTQSFVLCNVEGGPTKQIGTSTAVLKARRGAFTHWTCPLPSGTYVLIPFSVSFWEKQVRDSERNYTLVIHAKIPIELELVKEPASLLADCLIAAIIKEPETKNEHGAYKYYFKTTKSDFSVFIAENASFNNYLNLKVNMTNAKNVSSTRSSLYTNDWIPLRHRKIIFFTEWTNKPGEKARLTYTHQGSFVEKLYRPLPEINTDENDFHSCRKF